MMKKLNLFFVLFVGLFTHVSANPIDATPIAKFSELVFDEADTWTLELYFQLEYPEEAIDSIVINVSGIDAKINSSLNQELGTTIVTSDSLSTSILINRLGDQITLYTYSNDSYGNQIRVDKLTFGDQPSASVGPPITGYSIMRNSWRDSHRNYLTMDCLTKNPSLGEINDTLGLSGKLKGYIFDSQNRPVTALKVFPASPSYFSLHTPLDIQNDGSYSTQIFQKFSSETINQLEVKLDDFSGWLDSITVEPFELSNIIPDTILIQDIYLLDDEYILTNVRTHEVSQKNFQILNYPNPFNTSTKFIIDAPEQFLQSEAAIEIFNARGQSVKKLPLRGQTTLIWNGTNMNGDILPSGIYHYQLNFNDKIMDRGSLLLLK